MARCVFFSFHYDLDSWRANQVRQANVVLGANVAGFFDHSEYLEAKKRSTKGIENMLLRHIKRTSVTVVLLGQQTANRPWVQFEIRESIKNNNGLVGITIDHLYGPPWAGAPREYWGWNVTSPGPWPAVTNDPAVMPVYKWDGSPAGVRGFAQVIEEAGKRADALRSRAREKRLREEAARQEAARRRAMEEMRRPILPPPPPPPPYRNPFDLDPPARAWGVSDVPPSPETEALMRAFGLRPPPTFEETLIEMFRKRNR